MTLMGTVIVHDENAEVFPSKASEEAFIRTLVEGGKNDIYSCDEQKKCLHVTSKSIIIKQTESWAGRVEELLLSVQRKIFRMRNSHSLRLSSFQKAASRFISTWLS